MKYLILFISSLLFAANLIIQYPNLKKEYYNSQIIDLQIKIITPKEMNLTFVPPAGTELNITKPNPLIYTADIKYKNDGDIKKFFIISDSVYVELILNNLYKSVPLEKTNRFCNVLAEDLKVTNVISSKFNNTKNMISFTIVGKNANIEDFTLHTKDENLTVVSPDKATFFTLIDNNIKNIFFYYFNTSLDNYKKIQIPVRIKEETISTQTDINPEENTLFTPVNIMLLSIIAFFIIVFLIYQRTWLIFPPILLTVYLVYLNLPKGEVFLSRGTNIYILPTPNSTVFYTAPIGTKVQILKKTENYTKIQIQNKIGWVKNEDIGK
jgi:hypothetical protein